MAATDLYTPALLEHGGDPENKYEMAHPTHSHEGVNPSCGDDVVVHLRVEDGHIAEVSFTGSGCAVSQASADMMADALTGTTVGGRASCADCSAAWPAARRPTRTSSRRWARRRASRRWRACPRA